MNAFVKYLTEIKNIAIFPVFNVTDKKQNVNLSANTYRLVQQLTNKINNATQDMPFSATGPVLFRYKQVINNPKLEDDQIKQLLNIKKTSDLNMSTKSTVSDNNLTTISTILKNRGITPPQSFTALKQARGLSK
jgi:hypothetical protein